MLVIRMQRTGRKGHAQFRVVVQDSRRTPTSGRVIAPLGHYNPHTKEAVVDKEKVGFYLEHGAQPSDRVIRLLKAEKIKLPAWVKASEDGKRATRNPDKRRSTKPAEPKAEEPEAPAEPTEEVVAEPVAEEKPAAAEATEEPAAEEAETKESK
jgi:small subunit ribosomal protein S16